MKADISTIRVYVLKYLTTIDYGRYWSENINKKINERIGCSHFLLACTKLQLDVRSHDKLTTASFKKFKAYNVKLKTHHS